MKYVTTLEQGIMRGAFFLGVGIISLLAYPVEIMIGGDISEAMMISNPLILMGLIVFLPSFIAIQRHKFFLKKGKRYPAEIISADELLGKTCCYYLLIEFRVNGKRLIRRTSAYPNDPNFVLRNKKCAVYEYKGKYLEGDFQTKQNEGYPGYSIIKTNRISAFTRKKKHYV